MSRALDAFSLQKKVDIKIESAPQSIAFSLPAVDLTFDYDLPARLVHDWWTDLSGTGYVGKSLKSIRTIGREDDKILVETKWKVMRRNMKLIERFTPESANHWTWEPTIMRIHITDDFKLEEKGGRATLRIVSDFEPQGIKGKLSAMMFGRYLRKMMRDEWYSADDALRRELADRISTKK